MNEHVRWLPTGPPPEGAAALPSRLPAVTSDRVISVMRALGDMQVHVVITLGGTLDEVRLARAVRLLVDAEPVLGCRWVPSGRRPHWERRGDLDRAPLCTLVEVEAPEAAARAWLAEPGVAERDPILQVRIFRARTDVVVLKVNHLAADGGGSKECAYRLAALYRALGQAPRHQASPNLAGRRSIVQVLERLGPPARLRLFWEGARDRRRRMRPARYWRVPSAPGLRGPGAGGRTFVVRQVGPATFRRAKAWGRAHGATINDLLNAACVHGLLAWLQPPADLPLRLRTTVDLRRYLPGERGEAIANLSSFVHANLGEAGAGRTDFPGLALRMRDEMRGQKAGHIGLGEWAWLRPLLRATPDRWLHGGFASNVTPERQPELFTPALTNIGRIDPVRLDFGDVPAQGAYATPSVIFPPLFGMCATGFGESLTLSAGICAASTPRAGVAALLDHMTALLAALPEPPMAVPTT